MDKPKVQTKSCAQILTNIVNENRMDWDQKLHSTVWAYRVAYKTMLNTTPYNMVYGLNVATIHRQEMPNWISGCWLKTYHLPLTNEMLEREHASKERKIKR